MTDLMNLTRGSFTLETAWPVLPMSVTAVVEKQGVVQYHK